jgi:hypothetical protein
MRTNTVGVLLVGSLLLGGCSSNDNDSDGDVIEQVVLRETPVTVSKVVIQLVNTSGEPLPGVAVSVDDNNTGLLGKLVGRSAGIIGRSAAKKFAAKVTTLETDSLGFVTFDLAEGTTSGDLSVTVDESDYFPVTEIYSIGAESTIDTLTLTEKPLSGESVAVEAVNDDGEIEEVISLVADQEFTEEVVEVVDDAGISTAVQGSVSRIETQDADDETGEKTVVAEVLIPSTVEPTTASGDTAVGEITVTAAIYQNSSDVSIEAFPGGLVLGDNLENSEEAPAVSVSESEESDVSDTTGFITGGFVSLEVTDEEGNDITQFDGSTGVDIDGDGVEEQGLLVTSLISRDTVNPETGELVAVGDSIPVWSYDDETAKWTYDGESKVFEEADDKNLRARFAATHLSSWNLDFYVPYCTGLKLVIFRTPSGSVDQRQLRVTTKLDAGFTRTSNVYGDGYLYSWRSPRQNLKMSVIDRVTGESVAIQTINGEAYDLSEGYNFCSQGLVLKSVVLEEAPAVVDVNVAVQTSCSDESLDDFQPAQSVPSAVVNVLDETGMLVSTAVADNDGLVTISGLVEDANYNLYVEDRVNFGIPSVVPFSPETASDPVVVDFEQECVVTTGSAGGN